MIRTKVARGYGDSYFRRLCALVKVRRSGHTFYNLMQVLYEKPFTWFVPNDDNRIEDGLLLREKYENHLNNKDCSVLEVLIGIAIRMEFIMSYDDSKDRTSEWFWVMIDNLGLMRYSDDSNFYDEEVDEILNRLINRTYDYNGEGGLFPLRGHHPDQRRREIWYQMMSYLDENYQIN